MRARSITLTPRGEFSLAASIRFLTGFTPLSYDDDRADAEQTLRLAFAVEGDWRHVGDDLPGLRPVCFPSPYEAAAWAVLSQRVRMKQAANMRVGMCERLGQEIEVDGEALRTFPDPERLRATRSIDGLAAAKLQRLHGVADAALEGLLDGAALRASGARQAIESVREIPGIGPFGADLVVIRGAGEPDHFSRTERRLHAAMADAYGVDARDIDVPEEIAERWRPFRSWIGFLFRTRMSLAA